jgi:hypothetical protein
MSPRSVAVYVNAALLFGCPPAERPDDGCAAACAQLRALGCDEGEPSPEGKSCETVCRVAAEAGIALGTACVATASSCEAARACNEE